MIEWFFKSYLKEEFNIDNYRVSMPSKDSNFLEKCRTIISEMDGVLKQYNLFVEDEYIDSELFEISSEHIFFKNIKSLNENKYIYPKSTEFQKISYYFFSDQCMLSYLDRTEEKHSTFFSLITKEKVKKEEYGDYNYSDLEYLLNNNYIKENEGGYLEIVDLEFITIIKDLCYNEVISYWHHPLRNKIDELLSEEFLYSENTLFSKPEQDYFNYHLNDSEFDNALSLRNIYSHGTQKGDSTVEDIHKKNYLIFMKLFILIIIKINDDLNIKWIN